MKLFGESYRGLHTKDEYRLYFEEGVFGLFVWLTPDFELKSFQADYKSQIALHFNRPRSLRFARITNEPISGGIGGEVSEEERAIFRSNLDLFWNENLPVLFEMIRLIIGGGASRTFILPVREVQFLKALKYKDYCG